MTQTMPKMANSMLKIITKINQAGNGEFPGPKLHKFVSSCDKYLPFNSAGFWHLIGGRPNFDLDISLSQSRSQSQVKGLCDRSKKATFSQSAESSAKSSMPDWWKFKVCKDGLLGKTLGSTIKRREINHTLILKIISYLNWSVCRNLWYWPIQAWNCPEKFEILF